MLRLPSEFVRVGLVAAAALGVVACGGGSDGDATEPVDSSVVSVVIADDEPSNSETADGDGSVTDVGEDENTDDVVGDVDGGDGDTGGAVFPRDVEHALGVAPVAEQPIRVVALDGSLVDAVQALELSAIAPTIMTESAGGGWKDSIRLAAEATGREALGDELVADFEDRAARIGADINAAADNPEISIVRVVDVIRLYNPVSFSGTVFEDAGLARPESQRNRDDFVFYTVFGDPAVEAAVEDIQAGPLWSRLGAVERGDVHRVDDDAWMSGVGLFGAQIILDDLAAVFGVDP